MSDEAKYDNVNRGACFPPFEDQDLILQGRINVEGQDANVVLVKGKTRNGAMMISIYEKTGVLFVNEKTSEKAPDYSWPLRESLKLAGWKKVSESGTPYLSLSVSQRDTEGNAPDRSASKGGIKEDGIPF